MTYFGKYTKSDYLKKSFCWKIYGTRDMWFTGANFIK